MFISLCSLCSWIRANDDNLPDVIVLQRFFMRFILLNDRSHLTAVGGMVKRTPMIVKMPGCKSLYVCCRVSWSLETLMSAILHLTLHLAMFVLNVSYVWGRSVQRRHILSAAYYPAGQSVWKAISVAHSTDLHYTGCDFPFPELNGPEEIIVIGHHLDISVSSVLLSTNSSRHWWLNVKIGANIYGLVVYSIPNPDSGYCIIP